MKVVRHDSGTVNIFAWWKGEGLPPASSDPPCIVVKPPSGPQSVTGIQIQGIHRFFMNRKAASEIYEALQVALTIAAELDEEHAETSP